MTSVSADVLVIGGGLSGLAAAHEVQKLTNNKTCVLLLEAKDRTGGRVCRRTLSAANGQDTWDFGGQWVSSSQHNVLQLLKEFDLGTFPQFTKGEKKLMINDVNDIRSYKGLYPALNILELLDLNRVVTKINAMSSEISVQDPCACKHAAEWDSMTLQTFCDGFCRCKGTARTLSCAMRTIFGLESSQISLFYFLYYCAQAGGVTRLADHDVGDAQELRVQETAYELISKLQESVGINRINCNKPVASIDQSNPSRCIVTTEDGSCYSAKQVIIAIPPHLVNQIKFNPPLPIDRRRLGDRMPVGYLIKFIVTYTSAFWKDDGVSGESTVVVKPCSIGPICVTFDATSFRGNPALVGFIGGEHAAYWTNKTKEERQEAVVECLCGLFGHNAKDQLIQYEDKDWAHEPYNGGCPVSAMQPGCLIYFHQSLTEPFNRVHWAGTETAQVWTGYLDGAVEAGQRAAREVVTKLVNGMTSRPRSTVTSVFATNQPVRGKQSCIKMGSVAKAVLTAGVLGAAGYFTYRWSVNKVGNVS